MRIGGLRPEDMRGGENKDRRMEAGGYEGR